MRLLRRTTPEGVKLVRFGSKLANDSQGCQDRCCGETHNLPDCDGGTCCWSPNLSDYFQEYGNAGPGLVANCGPCYTLSVTSASFVSSGFGSASPTSDFIEEDINIDLASPLSFAIRLGTRTVGSGPPCFVLVGSSSSNVDGILEGSLVRRVNGSIVRVDDYDGRTLRPNVSSGTPSGVCVMAPLHLIGYANRMVGQNSYVPWPQTSSSTSPPIFTGGFVNFAYPSTTWSIGNGRTRTANWSTSTTVTQSATTVRLDSTLVTRASDGHITSSGTMTVTATSLHGSPNLADCPEGSLGVMTTHNLNHAKQPQNRKRKRCGCSRKRPGG